jgi:hypothetical protein
VALGGQKMLPVPSPGRDAVKGLDRSIDFERVQALAVPGVTTAAVITRSWDVDFKEAARVLRLTRATLLQRLAQLGAQFDVA